MSHLFEKGRSGNPGGRPKQAIHFTELARDHSEKALAVLVACLDSTNEKNRIQAASIIIERGWGKAIQEVKGDLGFNVTQMPAIQKSSGEANGVLLNRIAEYDIGAPDTSAQ